MKNLRFILILLYLTAGQLNAQTAVHYLVSSNFLYVGDSVLITPILVNAKPNSKVELEISDFDYRNIKDKLAPFYYKSEFSGKSVLKVSLRLSVNNKIYFNDSQLMTFSNFSLKANIYDVRNPLIVFIGLDNPFELDIPGATLNDVSLKCQGVSMKYTGANSFILFSNGNQEGKGLISVSLRKNDNYIKISEIPIIIKSAPAPSILANISNKDSSIYLKSVLNDQFILNFESGVDSFTLVYEKSGKKIRKIFADNKIDKATYLDLMSLPSGTWIYFEDIIHWVSFWGPKAYRNSSFAIKL
jgi:hypothetical protein